MLRQIKARHDRMVGLVTRMLDLHRKLAATTTPREKELAQRQVDARTRRLTRWSTSCTA